MKTIEYLSPSAIKQWRKDKDEFYYRYLSDNRPGREPQNQPMAIGSAFDAYAKNYLHVSLFGKNHTDSPKFEFTTIFEAQVEPQCRSWAIEAGKHVFDEYMRSGTMNDLILDLNAGSNQRFEFELRGVVKKDDYYTRQPQQLSHQGVVLLGKPDLAYVNRHGSHIILDWKVNGYCGRGNTSPRKGYLRLRESGRSNVGTMHKDCRPMVHKGTMINAAICLEDIDKEWAEQLSVYAWLLGEPIGGDHIYAIDQVACNGVTQPPTLRFAQHRLRCSAAFQHRSFAEICEIWDIVHSDHIFRDLTKEESAARCVLLDRRTSMGPTPLSDFISQRER